MAIFESIEKFAKRVGLSHKYIRSIAHTLPHVMCGNACMICIDDAIHALRQHALMCASSDHTQPPAFASGCQCEGTAAKPTAPATQ